MRGAKQLPPIPLRQNGKRGRVAKSDAHNLWERLKCRVPRDYIPKRSYPLFRTRQILNDWLKQKQEEATPWSSIHKPVQRHRFVLRSRLNVIVSRWILPSNTILYHRRSGNGKTGMSSPTKAFVQFLSNPWGPSLGAGLYRCQDDDCHARLHHPSLRHHRNWQ